MNISKNLLSIGLIAVISGISTAQTYTATAGTNGITDIQSDYSMSTGDGASVSVDVPLEFELPKKVAIAIKNNDSSFTTNPIFSNADFSHQPSPNMSDILNPEFSGWLNMSNRLQVIGAVYANTDVIIESHKYLYYNHESDPNSQFIGRNHFTIKQKDGSSAGGCYGLGDNLPTNMSESCPINISIETLGANDNILYLHVDSGINKLSINPTDRAGKYIGIQTFTISTL